MKIFNNLAVAKKYKRASLAIGNFDGVHKGHQKIFKNAKEFAKKNGYVNTIFGRKCIISDIDTKNPARRSFMERAAINAPIQGSAADIIKRAMIRMHDEL